MKCGKDGEWMYKGESVSEQHVRGRAVFLQLFNFCVCL